MKVGVIGLGDIARKAYLPVLTTQKGLELCFMTRNPAVLSEVADQYRIHSRAHSLEELIGQGIQVAFVHSSTESHFEIVTYLLEHGIHIFVDKPLDESLDNSTKMVELAETKGLSLMVGFNRRFAPAYRSVIQNQPPQLIVMQKNRVNSRGNVREIVYDDFIHVVDTLRFFVDSPIDNLEVRCDHQDQNLSCITINISTRHSHAIGIMHRHCGVDEEILETSSHGVKWRVDDVRQVSKYCLTMERILPETWSTTYIERGFKAMVESFVDSVQNGVIISARDALQSHLVCEEIIRRIESQSHSDGF